MIAKAKVMEHFGSAKKVAEFFDIEVQAVYQWPEKQIPRERELELLLKLPNVFEPIASEQRQ